MCCLKCLFAWLLSCCCSVDSTRVTGDGLGRFINDAVASEANCKMRVVEFNKTPHLAVYATRNISPNEEICFDYGVKDLPWRNKVSFVVY